MNGPPEARYEITEALMRVERAARDYIDAATPPARAVRIGLLHAELVALDMIRAKWEARASA